MSEYRHKIDDAVGRGARFELYELLIKGHSDISAAAPIMISRGVRQIRIVLEGGSVLLEPGALQYMLGKLNVEVQQSQGSGGNIFSRAVKSAGTGESAFATKYSGYGEIWTEPTAKNFIIAAMDSPKDALLLDDKAFFACEASITIKSHTVKSVQGFMAGNGLMQPKLEGAGVFIVEAPVPVHEVEVIELDGSKELIVDGDLMMMYSATLQVELRPLVRGLRSALRTGEGLVYAISGVGTVWLTPTSRLGGGLVRLP